METTRYSFYRAWNFFKKFLQSMEISAAALLAAASVAGAVELTPAERAHLDRALAAMNASVSDLGFQKDVGEPRDALGWIRSALHDPLALNRAASALWAAAESDESDASWRCAAELLESPLADKPALEEHRSAVDVSGLGEGWADAMESFLLEARRADALLDQAFSRLTREEMERLAVGALGGWLQLDDTDSDRAALEAAGISSAVIEDHLREERALDARPAAERFLDAAEKFDLGALLSAGRVFQRAVSALALHVKTLDGWPGATWSADTELGPIYVLGPEVTVFTNAALLVMGPTGDRRYAGPAGAANGLLGRRLAAIVELGGRTVYDGTELLGAASALFGAAVAIDAGGDDVWRADFAGPAAGIWGAGWLEDRAGDDVYISRAMGQGAAFAGLGALIDAEGQDRFEIGWYGQGFAGWRGFGLLLDRAGHDGYFAGGREPDHERNPDRFMSLAQGFAIGIRPFAGGGVGALIDLAGNDRYLAEVYGQGVSYYYSAGFLLDGAGHDRYDVHHYGQGCGIHLSLGLLVDFAGDDRYVGGTLAQGAAHDFAVGGLLDRGGDDTYIATRHAQGHGMNNALGWLLDAGGDDVYDGRDAETTQGVGNTGGIRDSGSLGLLLDLGGRDRYSSGGADDRLTLRPLYGIVYDVEAEEAP